MLCSYRTVFQYQCGFSRKNQWVKQSSLLQQKILTSLGKTSDGNEQSLTINEIHKALLLSCEHSPNCSRKDKDALQAGRQQPKPYDKKQALQNAEEIFRQKGWDVIK
jgi:hypothetical protein